MVSLLLYSAAKGPSLKKKKKPTYTYNVAQLAQRQRDLIIDVQYWWIWKRYNVEDRIQTKTHNHHDFIKAGAAYSVHQLPFLFVRNHNSRSGLTVCETELLRRRPCLKHLRIKKHVPSGKVTWHTQPCRWKPLPKKHFLFFFLMAHLFLKSKGWILIGYHCLVA